MTIHVRDFMSTALVTITPYESLGMALDLMRARRVRHLCVLEHEQLVAIVTDRDLHAALPSPHTGAGAAEYRRALDEVAVRNVMVRDPITVTPETLALHAVSLMRDRRLGCLPVLDGMQLVGIFTRSDCLELLALQLGAPAVAAPAEGPLRAAPPPGSSTSKPVEVVEPFWSSATR
jgi:acetoin utilization protein AcuB